jgi:hypothetical protein
MVSLGPGETVLGGLEGTETRWMRVRCSILAFSVENRCGESGVSGLLCVF